MKVTGKTLLCDAIKLHKGVARILKKYHMEECLNCKGNRTETVAYAAAQHGVDVEKLLKEINRLLKDRK